MHFIYKNVNFVEKSWYMCGIRCVKYILISCFLFVAELLSAQEITGTWSGELSVQNVKLPIAFRISYVDNSYKAVMDSPEQGAIGLPVESVKYDCGVLSLSMPSLNMTLSGMVRGTTLTAMFRQGNLQIPIVLVRSDESAEVRRPQEPRAPYPYRVEEVSFASLSQGVNLQGTLTLPTKEGKYPAVVLVTGSGTQNRDEEIMGHKPFKVIADYLTRRGVVILRYDDREFTTKQYAGATSRDYANDALGGVAYLKSLPNVDSQKIGIIGHSEGGTIAFMCAAQSEDVDFIVSLAGMAVSGEKCLLEQNRRSIAATGLPEDLQQRVLEAVRMSFSRVKSDELTTLKTSAQSIVDEIISKSGAGDAPLQIKQGLVKTFEQTTEWMKYFISYDPMQDIAKIKCNVLALNGGRDVQVLADDNLSVLAEAKNLAGRVTIKRYEELNHLFQPCKTGDVSEYASIEQTISEQVLEDVAAWVLKQ